jgi:GT2 family glycosyltransferase
MSQPRLTIGITTRNRNDSLQRCLLSLHVVRHLGPEVLIYDDGSEVPVVTQLAGTGSLVEFRVLRDESAPGYIAGRNQLIREAAAPAVLLLDDDAALIEGEAVERALSVLEADGRVAAVAFAQSDRQGNPWAETMQPGLGSADCYVPAFIGFAHLLRREIFLTLGGYRESFVYYGEEKDFCLRLLDAGYRTVYLPGARVRHEPDPSGRSNQRYLRYVTRNDCLIALYNEPWHRLIWLLPARLLLYFRMRRHWAVHDPWGWAWVIRDLWTNLDDVWRERRPVSSRTLELWQRLRRNPEPYIVPEPLNP